MGRALGAVVASLAVFCTAGTPAAALPKPGATSGFHVFFDGSSSGAALPVADIAGGFEVRVDPSALHAARIGPAIEFAVTQLSRYGIAARYVGISHVPRNATGYGQILVGESRSVAEHGCTSDDPDEAGIVIDGVAVPSFQDVGVARRINAARVIFCPPMWAHPQAYVRSIALHELGHAVGLAHYRDTFHGVAQVMRPAVPPVQRYQTGDVNGLRYLVAQTARLRAASVLVGRVEAWTVSDGGLAVTGWAVVGTTSQYADVSVTRDGVPVYAITTSTPRPDVVLRTGTGWPNSGFTGARIPMVDGTHRYCVRAAVPGGASAVSTLACRDLAYPVEEIEAPALPAATASAVTSSWPIALLALGIGVLGVLVLVLVLVRRRWRA